MDIVFIIFAGLAILAGLAGSVLPFLPGPPLAWAGLLLLHFSSYEEFSTSFLIWTAVVTAVITALDYFLPIWTARRSGGARYGQRGALIGMIIGLFVGEVKKISRGKADPKLTNELLLEKLNQS